MVLLAVTLLYHHGLRTGGSRISRTSVGAFSFARSQHDVRFSAAESQRDVSMYTYKIIDAITVYYTIGTYQTGKHLLGLSLGSEEEHDKESYTILRRRPS